MTTMRHHHHENDPKMRLDNTDDCDTIVSTKKSIEQQKQPNQHQSNQQIAVIDAMLLQSTKQQQ